MPFALAAMKNSDSTLSFPLLSPLPLSPTPSHFQIFDSPKRMGDPGEIGEKDHLRRIVHETLEFRPDEYIEAVQGTVNELCYIELTVVTNLGREHKVHLFHSLPPLPSIFAICQT